MRFDQLFFSSSSVQLATDRFADKAAPLASFGLPVLFLGFFIRKEFAQVFLRFLLPGTYLNGMYLKFLGELAQCLSLLERL